MAQRPLHACVHNAVIEKAGGDAAFPDEIRAAFHGSLARMRTSGHILGICKDIRQQIGKQPGDIVAVTVTER